ncbi:MAG: dicarboxylate/amino acid:cation symporter [Methylococcales bacterium]|nr:dicarboxylate/amino acid:cation symporter [Methylococcales bacterium]
MTTIPVTKKLYQHLYIQVLFAIAMAIILGHFYPQAAIEMKPLGDGFVKLIKMIIAPIIFCTVVTGISGMQDMKKLGRVGVKALLYFEVVSTIALLIGLVVIHVFQPGSGMNIDISTLDPEKLSAYVKADKPHSLTEFILNIIPSSVIDAFAKGETLQVLFFAVLFGISLAQMKKSGAKVKQFIETVSQALFGIVAMIMKLAPVGAFGAMAFTVGNYGVETLFPLIKFIGCFYLACFLFIFIVLGFIAKYAGFSILKFIVYIKRELFIVLGTCSTESVLPDMLKKMEKIGCTRSVVDLVIPTGYSFNLDGTSIYLSMAAIFVAQATNTAISFTDEVTLFGVLLLTSKGAAGVVGSAFIVLMATLSTLPTIPVESLVLILGIDRFMSEARAVTNLIGNGVATIVASNWEGELNKEQFEAELNHRETAVLV